MSAVVAFIIGLLCGAGRARDRACNGVSGYGTDADDYYEGSKR